MSEQKFDLSKEIWISNKLGFDGAYAGYNKTVIISKENPYFQVGTTMTIKVFLEIMKRVANLKLRKVVNDSGYKMFVDDEYGRMLYRFFTMHEMEGCVERKPCVASLTMGNFWIQKIVESHLKVKLWTDD